MKPDINIHLHLEGTADLHSEGSKQGLEGSEQGQGENNYMRSLKDRVGLYFPQNNKNHNNHPHQKVAALH